MRWRFANPNDRQYQQQRAKVLSRIDDWWKAFARDREKIAAVFARQGDLDLPAWMARHLQAIDERLMWEYGPGLKGGHRLVITPESDRHLRPLVDTILERAPRLEGWEFHAWRLPESVEHAHAMLRARKLAPVQDAKVRVTPGEHHRIDLRFASPAYSGPGDKEALRSVFIAAEAILGEETLDVWIGSIDVDRPREADPGQEPIPLERLRAAVEAEIERIRSGLPEGPLAKLPPDARGTVWKLKPEKQADYPRQDDLLVGRSIAPAVWMAAGSGRGFWSRRFSRAGELFCYVKLDGTADLAAEKFADKSEVEDALDKALKAEGGGAVIGGGTGLRYSYVDLALTDPDRGIRHVVEALRRGNIARRAWILFCDDIYRNEWIGAWDDSPPPPGME